MWCSCPQRERERERERESVCVCVLFAKVVQRNGQFPCSAAQQTVSFTAARLRFIIILNFALGNFKNEITSFLFFLIYSFDALKFKDFSREARRIRQRGWNWFFFFFPGRVFVWRIRHLGIRWACVGNFEALPRFSELEKTGGMISCAAYCEFFCVTTILWVPSGWVLLIGLKSISLSSLQASSFKDT
jgi:hypothetical protein